MYGALWRLIPGPNWVKALVMLLLAVAVFFLLMEVVFPYLSPLMPWNDVSV